MKESKPPYGIIWDLLKQGKVVPFLGAGASMIGRGSGDQWDPSQSSFLPNGRELAAFLADEANFPSKASNENENLAKVASYYSDMVGRKRFREKLRELLKGECQPSPLHEILADVPAPQVIVVTNYDTLMEQAFDRNNKPYDRVIYPADRKDLKSGVLWWPHNAAEPLPRAANELARDIDLATTNVIFKMHGSIIPDKEGMDNFVITEEDYVEFLSRMTANTAIPALFHEHFRERSFLFLGYSLNDWNLRVLMKNLSKHLSAMQGRGYDDEEEPPPASWAIQKEPSVLDEKLWGRRNIHIFNAPLDVFSMELKEKAAKLS